MPQIAAPPLPLSRRLGPGLGIAALIAAGALALRGVTGIATLSPMLVAVLAGMVLRACGGVPVAAAEGVAFAMRPVLRAGIVLLGLQLTLAEVAALGAGAFLIAAVTLGASYVAIRAMGVALGVPRPLAMLIAAGTSVCGASAVIAANSVARGSEEDVTCAIACVTLFGTLAMLVQPLLAGAFGMEPMAAGIWVGASMHEVAQVTVAAFQMGDAAGHAGTVIKLTRVMLLAPLIVTLALAARQEGGAAVPFPWFVAGFVAMMLVSSTFDLPGQLREGAGLASVFLLSTGLAAMGLSTDFARLRARGGAALLLGLLGWVFIAGFSLLMLAMFRF